MCKVVYWAPGIQRPMGHRFYPQRVSSPYRQIRVLDSDIYSMSSRLTSVATEIKIKCVGTSKDGESESCWDVKTPGFQCESRASSHILGYTRSLSRTQIQEAQEGKGEISVSGHKEDEMMHWKGIFNFYWCTIIIQNGGLYCGTFIHAHNITWSVLLPSTSLAFSSFLPLETFL